jgi:hypothetical protein
MGSSVQIKSGNVALLRLDQVTTFFQVVHRSRTAATRLVFVAETAPWRIRVDDAIPCDGQLI